MIVWNYWARHINCFLGDKMVLLDGRHMSAVCGGFSGSEEPQWPDSVGISVTDGTIVWMCVKPKNQVFIPEWMGPGTPANAIIIPVDEPEPELEVFNLFEERDV